MKTRNNPFLLISAVFSVASAAHAVDFTWDGGTGNWTDTNWNGATASGPTTAGNTATINSGTVTANVGVGGVDSITMGGGQLNVANNPGVYQSLGNLILQGGTVSGSGNYNAYGASLLGNLTVSGSAASTITGSSWFNLGSSTTFTVADATGDSASDLLVNLSLRSLPGSPDYTYLYNSKIIKEGAGTMEVTVHSYFNGGLDLNGGTLSLSGGNSGYGFFAGAVNVNSGTTLTINSDGTGFGYQSGWKPSSVNINGGTVNGGGHIWGISGGVNMTGGTLDSSGGFQWNYTNLNTLASADTATVSGPLNLRGDGGYTTMAVDVADGAATTDLLISGNISGASMNITKSGAGTMELSGANSYSGTTTVNDGTLVLSGSSSSTNTINVSATGTLALSTPIVDDAASVVVASGGQVVLNFTGSDTVGSLDLGGSGPLPADTYSSSHGTYGSYFTGTGSLVILGESSTWTSLSDGIWSDAANWAASTVATGYDNTATFNAATGATVTLDTNRVIGKLVFDVSDYILAGANTLSLQGAATPTISVGTGRSATVSTNIGGTQGLEKTGDGSLVLSGLKSYTGGTTVTGGTLELSSTSFDQAAVNGSVTVNSGATLNLSGFDFSGLGRVGSTVTYLAVDGGTVNNTINSFVSGAAVDLTAATLSGGTYHVINTGFNSLDSATTSTISSNLLIRVDYGSSNLNLNVGDGAAATDLLVSGNIGSVFTAGVNKNGSGKLVLSGTNTYTGNTVVNDGDLEVTSGLRFRPTTNGATNKVTSTGSGALSFLGTVDLDLSAANTTDGNLWNLFELASFAVAPSLSGTTGVTSTLGAFSEVSAGTWELPVTGAKWVFTEADGNLAYVVTATDYDTWADSFSLAEGPTGDDDKDGLTNEKEYAFGLIPNSGSSVNPIVVPFDKTTGTFSYTRRATPTTTGLSYTVWTSTNLGSWAQDSGALEGTITTSGEVETVPVTISSALLSNPKLFIQVRAD